MTTYNTGPCASRVFFEVIKDLNLSPVTMKEIELASQQVDQSFVSMLAVVELAHFVQDIKFELPLVPLVYSGVYDVDTDEMFASAVFDWDFDKTPCVLIAGQHEKAGNRPLLEESLMQAKFKNWTGEGVKIYSQVNADNTPQQADWVADKVEELGLTAIAIRAHPFHGARAFLTQLEVFKKRDLHRKVVLVPWWRPFNPFGKRRLTQPWEMDVWSDADLLPGEAKRIIDYRSKGDVASHDELKAYIDWLFCDSPVAATLSQYTD